jgi:hypothetical protein
VYVVVTVRNDGYGGTLLTMQNSKCHETRAEENAVRTNAFGRKERKYLGIDRFKNGIVRSE